MLFLFCFVVFLFYFIYLFSIGGVGFLDGDLFFFNCCHDGEFASICFGFQRGGGGRLRV